VFTILSKKLFKIRPQKFLEMFKTVSTGIFNADIWLPVSMLPCCYNLWRLLLV